MARVRYRLHIRTANGFRDNFALTMSDPVVRIRITPTRSRHPGIALMGAGAALAVFSVFAAFVPFAACPIFGPCLVDPTAWFVAAGIGAAITVGLEAVGLVLYWGARGDIVRVPDGAGGIRARSISPWIATGPNAFVVGATTLF